MENTYKIIWSDEAINNLKAIINYLENSWTSKEIKKFAQLIDKRINLIKANPFLFPESSQSSNLRKSVLSKQTCIYCKIIYNEIRIISLFDNRQNPHKLKDL